MSKRKQAPAVPEPTAEFMWVTPERALEWLDLSIEKNRMPRNTKVETLKHDIEEGLFIPTNQGIGFNLEGKLFDGQHRLQACVASGESIWLLVVRNLPVQVMQVIDQNTPRTIGDSLRWRNETDVNILGSIIKLACMWERELFKSWEWKWKAPSTQECLRWFDQHEPQKIREALTASRPMRKKPVSLTASVAAVFYWIAHERYPLETEDFVTAVEVGANLDQFDPALAYRNWQIDQKWEPGQLDQRTKLAQILRAFGARLEGQRIKSMKTWQPDSKKPNEDFPELPDIRPAHRPIPAQPEAVAAGSGQ